MAIFKKKEVVESPDSKIQGADVHIEAQKVQLNVIIDEMYYAMNQRSNALKDLDPEIVLLRIELTRKEKQMEYVLNENQTDKGFIERLTNLLNKGE